MSQHTEKNRRAYLAKKAKGCEHLQHVPQIPDDVERTIRADLPLTPEQEAHASAAIKAACEILRPRHLAGNSTRSAHAGNLRTYTGGRVVGGSFQPYTPSEAF